MRVFLTAVCAFLLTGCITQPPKLTGERWPQAVINTPRDQLREKMLTALAAKGATIDDSSESLIQARILDENAAMSKAFFGCGFCADPYIKLSVVLAAVGDATQVVIQYWRMIPQPNGSEQRMEIDSNVDFNQAQQMLWNLRDKFNAQSQ